VLRIEHCQRSAFSCYRRITGLRSLEDLVDGQSAAMVLHDGAHREAASANNWAAPVNVGTFFDVRMFLPCSGARTNGHGLLCWMDGLWPMITREIRFRPRPGSNGRSRLRVERWADWAGSGKITEPWKNGDAGENGAKLSSLRDVPTTDCGFAMIMA